MTALRWFIGVGLSAACVATGPPPAPALSACVGDCNADGTVTTDEIGDVVAAMFDPAQCPAADGDDNGLIAAAELVRVVTSIVRSTTGCAPLASTWHTLAPIAAGPRQELGVAAVDATVYAIGGFDGFGRGVPLVEAYDIARDHWTRVADMPQARNHAGAASVAGLVYSVGGFTGSSFQPANDVFRYDPDLDHWTSVAPLPLARGALVAVEMAGQLHAVGGSGASGSVTRHDVYDPVADMWTGRAALPTARNHLAGAAIDGKLYIVGGRLDGSGFNNTNELDCYDPVTDRWEILAPMPTARSGHAAAVWNGRLVALGGEVNVDAPPTRTFPQVEVYDPATGAWQALAPMPVPRHGIGAVTVGELLYVPGGATQAGFGATAHHDALEINAQQ